MVAFGLLNLHNSLVAVKLEGRLGNQLFQYAFIYAVAKKLNTKFYLDKSIDYLLIDKYFNIEKDFCTFWDNNIFSIKGYKNIFSHHLRYKYYSALQQVFGLKNIRFENKIEPSLQLEDVKNNLIYHGFFQSELYFKDYIQQVKKLFGIKKEYIIKFRNILSTLSVPDKYVAVHIRRGDYISHQIALDYSYFHKAIESIHKPDNFYIFVSDEVEIVEKEFDYLYNKYVSRNTEIIDFQIIMNADICILSNSSFSWWAAYLNNKNPTVITPKYWIGQVNKKEHPVKVIHPSWIKF